MATHLAQFLLCESPERAGPCGRCAGCRWFKEGNHPDFRLVQPEAMAELPEDEDAGPEPERTSRKGKPSMEIKVDQVRALGDFLYVGSHRGARRVAMIHPAEAMNPSAANALLKALEEPPASAVFLLVSHDAARLLATVRSRCVRIPIPVPGRAEALSWLKSEGIATPERWLAFAGGAPLLAAEYASGPNSEELSAMQEALAGGRPIAVNSRESLELLAEVMQKRAYDLAFSTLAGRGKYGTGTGRGSTAGRAWLEFARDMGRARRLARRPLNAGLFGTELAARYADLLYLEK